MKTPPPSVRESVLFICPVCEAVLEDRGSALWCERCYCKCVTCCEGAPQPP